jgi:hypothetical protein
MSARRATCPTCGFVICEACHDDHGPSMWCEECYGSAFVVYDNKFTGEPAASSSGRKGSSTTNRTASTSVLIERVDDAAPPELVEVIAADALSFRAAERVSNDGLGVRLVLRRAGDASPAALERTPAMTIIVGDLHNGTSEPLVRLRQSAALNIAVVAAASAASGDMRRLVRDFDAVIPAYAGPDADAEVILARAVSAVTAFATANRVSVPVDEAYPFFERGGLMTWGDGEDADLVGATEAALAGAGVRGSRRPRRILLHVESTQGEYITDLRLAAETVQRITNVGTLYFAASVRPLRVKRVSVVAAAVR